MDILVNIECQVYENYNITGDGMPDGEPRWKAKGGQTFTINMNIDLLMYNEEGAIKVFKNIAQKESNPSWKYDYVSHEPIFREPIHLDYNVNSMVDMITE